MSVTTIRCKDGVIRVRSGGHGVVDVSVESRHGPSAAVYLNAAAVAELLFALRETQAVTMDASGS